MLSCSNPQITMLASINTNLMQWLWIPYFFNQWWKKNTHYNQNHTSTRCQPPWYPSFPGPLNYLVLFEHWKMTSCSSLERQQSMFISLLLPAFITQHKPQQKWMAKHCSWHWQTGSMTAMLSIISLQPNIHELPKVIAPTGLWHNYWHMLPPPGMSFSKRLVCEASQLATGYASSR